MMEIAAGVLIGISFSLETLGFYFRAEGARLKVPAVGYSIHVQVATLSRVGTFMGLPMLGWMLDAGYPLDRIIIAPIITSIVYIVICVSVTSNSFKLIQYLNKLFIFFSNWISKLAIVNDPEEIQYKIVGGKKFKRLLLVGALSYVFVVVGGYGMTMLASIFNDYRATLLQLSPAITAWGTLLSVIYFDPRVSRYIDLGYKPIDVIKVVVFARVVSMSVFFVTLVTIALFL
jgi:hypothetical protein